MDKIKLKNHEFELAGGHRTLEDVFEFDLVKTDEMSLTDVHDIFNTKEETTSITIIYNDEEFKIIDGYTQMVFFTLLPKNNDKPIDIITVGLKLDKTEEYKAKTTALEKEITDLQMALAEVYESLASVK